MNAALNQAYRPEESPRLVRRVPFANHRPIVYLSEGPSVSQCLIESYIEHEFGCLVQPVCWGQASRGFNENPDPCLIIIDPPSSATTVQRRDLWEKLRQKFPKIPAMWVS